MSKKRRQSAQDAAVVRFQNRLHLSLRLQVWVYPMHHLYPMEMH